MKLPPLIYIAPPYLDAEHEVKFNEEKFSFEEEEEREAEIADPFPDVKLR